RMKYCFEPLPKGRKVSYNSPPAGQDLLARGFIPKDEAHKPWAELWDQKEAFPATPPTGVKAEEWEKIIVASRDSPYYKYRGRGLNQVTWASNYKESADKWLKAATGKTSGEMTNDELDAAMFKPEVYFN